MSVEIIDGTTIANFVEDEEAFSASVNDLFAQLDADKDGFLSYKEMVKELQRLRVMETHFGVDVKREPEEVARVYESLFVQFDHDMNGRIDKNEFKKETKKMLLAMANGLGSLPIQMALEHDSLLLKAVKHEYSYGASANDNLLANAA
ncbi:hypothetical protein HN51_049794 [Arachis hypogaea]|uniref:EF-hand domain-containing protein n=1 Tax=Arachis hypogaea TaxID=3818 RepID=A0A444YDV8_ARAHY|nr:uncharacterized protein LOC107608361 [Arachis ipaensis]XP_025668860.1 uncharacterized protein LOC112767190 [Arachis hypogaea]RYR00112.1 hypothetical protein Ahy_B07g088195 [Arachis hypogaea]